MRATTEKQAVHGPVVGQVEHRHCMQKTLSVTEHTLGHGGHCRESHVVVTEHHALGETRGAAGVENPQ
ncbi:hypothetical protein D3C85_1760700 [compost metagenome]